MVVEGNFKIDWIDNEREPQNPSDPRYPHGIDLDMSKGAARTCTAKLAYPAPRCGVFYVECRKCGRDAIVTTAGRADDPRSIKLACDKVLQ
jgi:hypothetical protein